MADKFEQEVPGTLAETWNQGLHTDLDLNKAKQQLRETIARRLKSCRLERKLTQEQLSIEIGFNHLTYRGYENCKSDIPIVYLVKLADFYNVTLDYLTGRTDTQQPVPEIQSEAIKEDPLEQRIAQLERAIAELSKR